jgi:hypothetical protein
VVLFFGLLLRFTLSEGLFAESTFLEELSGFADEGDLNDKFGLLGEVMWSAAVGFEPELFAREVFSGEIFVGETFGIGLSSPSSLSRSSSSS